MPCSDGREHEVEEDNRHMRQGAALLCSLLKEAEGVGALYMFPTQIVLWWEEHKIRDKS